MRPKRLKLGTHVDSGKMYHVYRNQVAAAYSSLYFFIFLCLQFSNIKFFVTLFSGTVMPEEWNMGHSGQWTDVSCIPESGCCCLFVSLFLHFFFSAIFKIKCFATLFSETVRPKRLELGTHVDSGQIYHVYRNLAASSHSSLYFFIFFSLQFSTLKFFITRLY